MDNRWSNRKGLELGVDVYHQGDKLASCRSKDIGLGGAYLEPVNINDTLFIDANVDLVFHLIEGTYDVKYALHARIVRIDEEGIGLKFHAFDTAVFRSLQQLMTYKTVQEAVH